MFKFISAIALSLMFIFLVKEFTVELFSDPLSVSVDEPSNNKQQKILMAEKEVNFYPQVPHPLPNLNHGYLFNEERLISVQGEERFGEAKEVNRPGPTVDMDNVFYAGSIIVGEVRKGLVVYTLPRPSTPQNRRMRPTQVDSRDKERNYMQLAVGTKFSGYKVIAIEPDRIVFSNGLESIEKKLNDPQKARIAAPILPKRGDTKTRQNGSTLKNNQRNSLKRNTSMMGSVKTIKKQPGSR